MFYIEFDHGNYQPFVHKTYIPRNNQVSPVEP